MSDPVILNNSKAPFGRYMIEKGDTETHGFFFYLESIEHEGKKSFWLPVKNADGYFVAYFKFIQVDPDICWPGPVGYRSNFPSSVFLLNDRQI